MTKNAEISKMIAWKKLQIHSKMEKKNIHFIKFASIISHSYHRTILSQSFRKIQLRASTLNDSYSNKLFESRKVLILQALQRYHKKWLGYSFFKIQLHSILNERQLKSVKSLNVLYKGMEERNKLISWNRLTNVPSGEHKDLEY